MAELLTLDQDSLSVRRLSLAALEAASKSESGEHKVARRAFAAYTAAMNDGASEDDAILAAQGVLRAALKG